MWSSAAAADLQALRVVIINEPQLANYRWHQLLHPCLYRGMRRSDCCV